MAKTTFDRAPNVCGVVVSAEFISENDVKVICDSIVKESATRQEHFPSTSWYSESTSDHVSTSLCGQEQSDSPIYSKEKDQENFPKWGSITSHSGSPYVLQSSNSKPSTPGSSSLWNDGGFLSGLSSPWHHDISSPSPSSNVDSMTPAASMTTNPSVSGAGLSTMSTFLPNGLL